jgi:hypothetical protein
MSRFFNTAGPNKEDMHYTLEPTERLGNIRQMVDEERYFILHAPRQTGKTTSIIALMHEMNKAGKYVALYVNIEAAQALRNNVEAANKTILSAFRMHALHFLPEELRPTPDCYDVLDKSSALSEFLQHWVHQLAPKPLVVFMDEVDALIGDSLLSVLRQLRMGYNMRPTGFPHSIALIGLRDIRDYRIFSDAEQRYVIGGSAFNIKDESLSVATFTEAQMRALYAQHTAETGQVFEEEALALAFYYTQGQPWLVNAVGRTVCFEEIAVPHDQPITAEHIRKAVEVLILRRRLSLAKKTCPAPRLPPKTNAT